MRRCCRRRRRRGPLGSLLACSAPSWAASSALPPATWMCRHFRKRRRREGCRERLGAPPPRRLLFCLASLVLVGFEPLRNNESEQRKQNKGKKTRRIHSLCFPAFPFRRLARGADHSLQLWRSLSLSLSRQEGARARLNGVAAPSSALGDEQRSRGEQAATAATSTLRHRRVFGRGLLDARGRVPRAPGRRRRCRLPEAP